MTGRFARLGGGVIDLGRSIAPQRPKLRLRPPQLTNPRTIRLHNAMPYDASQQQIRVNLGPGDWIIELPKHEPLTKGVLVHGLDVANDVVVIGGAIHVPAKTDFTTMQRNGAWALYAQRGFTGATGGTFRARTSETGTWTAPLAWDATPAAIKAALEAVPGFTGAVKAVDGPASPGGPWKFVPADDRLGMVALDLAGLTGTPAATTPVRFYWPGDFGLTFKQMGPGSTVHVEGVDIDGPGLVEGINIMSPWDETLFQFANVRATPTLSPFQLDWHHPDAMQAFLGPTELRMERCYLSAAQGLMAQPRRTSVPAALEGLRDWWFADCLFEVFASQAGRTTPFVIGHPMYMIEDYPSINGNGAGWKLRMENCYAVVAEEYAGGPIKTAATDGEHWQHGAFPPPAGLTLRARPPRELVSRKLNHAGINYSSPGYGGPVVPAGTKRLQGETKLT